jgi:tRNA splicing endonuclease
MQKHLQRLIHFLTKNDIKSLLQHYLDSTEAENIVQLGFMFKQGQIKSYDFYQQLATGFIENKGFSVGLIAKIETNNTLNFFTPALQTVDNFGKIDSKQRNVLHYLFTNNKLLTANAQPPFNYLRSMMLFGSNKALNDGLCQRDQQNLSPIEAYLFTNINFTTLANHELTALLALIEIESRQQEVVQSNYDTLIHAVGKSCRDQAKAINHDLQRIILIATYYTVSIDQVVNDMK